MNTTKTIGKWSHYKKTASIDAIRVSDALKLGLIAEDLKVVTLENPAGQTAALDQWLCQAKTGEYWVQKDAKIRGAYDLGEPDEQGWLVAKPKPDAEGVLAAKITDRPNNSKGEVWDGKFQVVADWGVLTGQRGDYKVNNLSDPADSWIVQGPLFESTYELA